MNSCLNCLYYNPIDLKEGQCRFNPPVLINHGSATLTHFPIVKSTDWCGQWAVLPKK